MYNENASMGKRRRENRKRVAEYTRKKVYESARKKYVEDNVKSTEETDYFEKVKTLEVEEKVNTEAEVQNEEEKEVYNKIRAWREITDKEKKKEEPVMVNTTESDVNQKEPGIEAKNFKSYDKELPEEDIAKMYQKALEKKIYNNVTKTRRTQKTCFFWLKKERKKKELKYTIDRKEKEIRRHMCIQNVRYRLTP